MPQTNDSKTISLKQSHTEALRTRRLEPFNRRTLWASWRPVIVGCWFLLKKLTIQMTDVSLQSVLATKDFASQEEHGAQKKYPHVFSLSFFVPSCLCVKTLHSFELAIDTSRLLCWRNILVSSKDFASHKDNGDHKEIPTQFQSALLCAFVPSCEKKLHFSKVVIDTHQNPSG